MLLMLKSARLKTHTCGCTQFHISSSLNSMWNGQTKLVSKAFLKFLLEWNIYLLYPASLDSWQIGHSYGASKFLCCQHLYWLLVLKQETKLFKMYNSWSWTATAQRNSLYSICRMVNNKILVSVYIFYSQLSRC